MDLIKPLGTLATATRDTVRHPVGTGLKVVGRSIGLVRGAASAVTGHTDAGRDTPADHPAPEVDIDPAPDLPTPRTLTPGDMPTPADLAERIERSESVTTPVGTTGAGVAYNPDTAETDLQQPGTEPLMDPATTKAVASEARILGRAADTDKG